MAYRIPAIWELSYALQTGLELNNIICSEDTVDVYNPKVVQASMGSLSRINVYYADLTQTFNRIELPVFGALLDGENIYHTDFGDEGLIVMGNEGNGIGLKLSG